VSARNRFATVRAAGPSGPADLAAEAARLVENLAHQMHCAAWTWAAEPHCLPDFRRALRITHAHARAMGRFMRRIEAEIARNEAAE